MTNSDFINLIGDAAVKEYDTYRILPSLTIAQAILESAWGRSQLSTRAFNYFGMKAGKDWHGAVYNAKTQEHTPAGQPFTITAAFRAYGSVRDGIRGYYEFLQYPRYRNLKGVTDYRTACRLIKEDGWATDVNYTSKLISLIETYHLDRFDMEVFGEMVETDKVIVNDKEFDVSIIRKDGKVFASVRDLAPLMGFDVSNKGRIPVLTEREG